MKAIILSLVGITVISGALSSCQSTAHEGKTSFAHLEGTPDGKPQKSGWTTNSDLREAERRSISRDIPYGVVYPTGNVIIE